MKVIALERASGRNDLRGIVVLKTQNVVVPMSRFGNGLVDRDQAEEPCDCMRRPAFMCNGATWHGRRPSVHVRAVSAGVLPSDNIVSK
jgi:hypothetical protein